MFKVRGLNEVLKEIRQLRQADKVVEDELQNIANAILQGALQKVPVDKGDLKASAYVNKIDNGWVVGFSAKYAPYQEFGTGPYVEVPTGFEDFAMEFYVNGKGHVQAQPFLLPAFFEERDKAVVTLEEAIRKHFNLAK